MGRVEEISHQVEIVHPRPFHLQSLISFVELSGASALSRASGRQTCSS